MSSESRLDKGSTMIMALLILILLSTFSLSLISMSTINLKMNTAHRDYQSTYYIAEAGIMNQIQHIHGEILNIYFHAPDADSFFTELDKHMPGGIYAPDKPVFREYFHKTFGIELGYTGNRDGNIKTYTITCRGRIENIYRSVATKVNIAWIPKDGNYNDYLDSELLEHEVLESLEVGIFKYSGILEI